MAIKLTKRQTEILGVIEDRITNSGSPPTRAEIAQIMGFSSANAAEDHLRALARKGVIELKAGTSRGIKLLKGESLGIPVVGKVAAGNPILSEENIAARHKVDKALFSNKADYLLVVQGDSMMEDGIMDSDLLVVHKTHEVAQGQLVVARINDQVTVKRFYRDNNTITLKPANKNYEPIIVDLHDTNFIIEGVGVGVIRTAV